MSNDAIVTAAVLIIGDEILSGRTRDSNLAWLAGRLTGLGIRLREARVVPDVEAEIIAAADTLRARYTYLFTTGGIGPTHDDITAPSIAKAFGVALERNAEAVRRLTERYGADQLNPARLRMAMIPAGAALIDNLVSAAPGFRIGNVFVMAGVPVIMQAMFDGLASSLAGGPPVLSRTVSCALPEGVLAGGLAAVQARHPEVAIGSYPFYRREPGGGGIAVGVSVVLRDTDPGRLDAAEEAVCALIRSLGGEPRREDGAVS